MVFAFADMGKEMEGNGSLPGCLYMMSWISGKPGHGNERKRDSGGAPSHCKKKARVEQKDSESLLRLPAGEGQGQNSPEFPSAAGGSGDGDTEKPSEM